MKIILFLTLTTMLSCSARKDNPGYEFAPDMVYSQAYEAYGESSITPNGSSMLAAPEKSIPRGYKVFAYGSSDDEKERAGAELTDPRASTQERMARGKLLYDKMCLVCHGATGQGDGPVAAKYSEPPAFNGRALRNYNDGQLYHAIVVGYGDMPSHAVQLDDNDRWDVILYLHQLQKSE